MINYPTSFPSDAALRLVTIARSGQLVQKRDEAGLYAWNVAGYGLSVGLGVPQGVTFGGAGGSRGGRSRFGDDVPGGHTTDAAESMARGEKSKEEEAARSFPGERNLTIAEKAEMARTVKSPADPSHTDPRTRTRHGAGQVVEHLTTGEILIDKAEPGGGQAVSAADAAAGHTQRPVDDKGLPHKITRQDLAGPQGVDPSLPVGDQVGTGDVSVEDAATARPSDKVTRVGEAAKEEDAKKDEKADRAAANADQSGTKNAMLDSAEPGAADKDKADKDKAGKKAAEKKAGEQPKSANKAFKSGNEFDADTSNDAFSPNHPAVDALEGVANDEKSGNMNPKAADWLAIVSWALAILQQLNGSH